MQHEIITGLKYHHSLSRKNISGKVISSFLSIKCCGVSAQSFSDMFHFVIVFTNHLDSFQSSVAFDTETSHLVYSADQMIRFYMK